MSQTPSANSPCVQSPTPVQVGGFGMAVTFAHVLAATCHPEFSIAIHRVGADASELSKRALR